MSERHITDEEVHQASGKAPRVPSGVPRATCLNCGQEYYAFYATMAHECNIDLAEKKTYSDWLLNFQRLGYGILKSPAVRKFRTFDKEITGRQMLTEHLQADLLVGTGYELMMGYYFEPQWQEAGFVNGLR